MKQKIVITGGAGFIGGELVKRYVHKGFDVTIVDSLKRNRGGVDFIPDSRVTFLDADITNVSQLKGAFVDADFVVHAAAIAGVDSVARRPVDTMEINVEGSSNVLRLIKDEAPNVKKVVLFSTSEVFGKSSFKTREEDSPTPGSVGEARWVYAISKLATEHLARAYYQQYGLPCVTVRPFNVYGPGQLGEGAMHVFIRRALENKDITIFGDGTSIRGWCLVNDFIDGLELVISSGSELNGESLNIGDPRSVLTTLGLAQTVCRVLNSNSKIVFGKELSADVELRVPNIEKAKRLLQYTPMNSLEEGILMTAEYYRELGNRLPKLSPIFGED